MNLPPELIETLLTRSTSSILHASSFESADKSSLFCLNRLTQHYLTFLAHRFLAFQKTNRRHRINHDDIELALFMEGIALGPLEDELLRLNHSPRDEFEVSETKVAKGFEGIDRKIQNALLGPDLNGRKRGIPDYMEKGMILPALPPLYTHFHTPVYAERIRSPLEIRQGLAAESHKIERSLTRLIELEESTNHEDTEMKDEGRDGKALRAELFDQTWREMGFGDPPRVRATKWSFPEVTV